MLELVLMMKRVLVPVKEEEKKKPCVEERPTTASRPVWVRMVGPQLQLQPLLEIRALKPWPLPPILGMEPLPPWDIPRLCMNQATNNNHSNHSAPLYMRPATPVVLLSNKPASLNNGSTKYKAILQA